MKNTFIFLFVCSLAFRISDALEYRSRSLETEPIIDEEGVRALFFLWNQALQTGNSDIVTRRYAKNAILLPTVSDTPRTSYESIKEYFDKFLLNLPSGKIAEGEIMIGDKWAQDVGIYEFAFGANGSRVTARYTYVYVYEDGFWRIAQHQSSVLPEQLVVGVEVTEEEVRGFFDTWNTALATLDSETVTNLYAKDAVLLPTVSDTPRTNHELIKDYFDSFLKKEPQGVILESYVDVGVNWAQDVGIYEFTFGADGSKVKARYAYVYAYEEGEWKIQHHHSSVLPEGVLAMEVAQAIDHLQVRALFDAWNVALEAGDVEAITAMYHEDAVLIPADSESILNKSKDISEYYSKYVEAKPSVKILDGHVRIGFDYAQDVGISEVTLGDGSVIEARYSLTYLYKDDAWKISNHHTSITL